MKTKIALTSIFIGIALLSGGCASLQNSGTRTIQNWTNSKANITCYSGGKIIYEGKTTTKPESEQGSDGYYFQDKDGIMEVSGDCVVRYIN